MMKFFSAADRLSLLFMFLLSVIAVLFVPGTFLWKLLALYGTLAAALCLLAVMRAKNNHGNNLFYISVGFTVALIFLIFNSVGTMIAGMHAGLHDRLLIAVDYALFGFHPTIWMERLINPLLTTVLQIAYISYYGIPVSLGIALVARGKRKEFDHAWFGIVLCFYLSYIGYLMLPAVGPRFTLAALQTRSLEPSPFVAVIQQTLNGLEHNKTDAFPSGHTAIALVSLYYAWELRERLLFKILIPVVLALVFSTVYLRYHYVIDVIAGAVLAALTVALAPILYRRFSGPAAEAGKEHHRTA